MNATLNTGHEVGNFTVVKYLKTYGINNAESYRVTDSEGNDAIMKLIVDGCSSLEFSHEVCELLSQTRAMPSVKGHGVINVDSIDYKFMIRESVEGVKLSELLDLGITYTWEEAVPIVMQVLGALSVLEFPKPQANGELYFAASVLSENEFPDNPEACHGLCPYYFLAHMPEGYVAGEVLTDMDDYPVVYHDTFPDAGLYGFLRWILQKSGLDVAVEDLRQL